jgi:transposase InsO family protein
MRLQAEAYPVAEICAVVGLARSTFYHAAEETEAEGLRQALLTLAGEYPTYGYRRLTALLRRAGWTVTHKRIHRLM